MNDNVRRLLDDELERELENLENLEIGSEGHSKATESLVKLYKLRIEEEANITRSVETLTRKTIEDKRLNKELELKEKQFDKELELKEKQFDKELELKEKQFNNEVESNDRDEQFKRDQLKQQLRELNVKIGVEVGLAVLQLMFYASYMRKGFKFEETGTVTSPTFRNLISNFKPKRK